MVWFQTAYAKGLPLKFVGMDQLSKSLFVYFETKYQMFVCALHSDYHKLFFYFLRHEWISWHRQYFRFWWHLSILNFLEKMSGGKKIDPSPRNITFATFSSCVDHSSSGISTGIDSLLIVIVDYRMRTCKRCVACVALFWRFSLLTWLSQSFK